MNTSAPGVFSCENRSWCSHLDQSNLCWPTCSFVDDLSIETGNWWLPPPLIYPKIRINVVFHKSSNFAMVQIGRKRLTSSILICRTLVDACQTLLVCRTRRNECGNRSSFRTMCDLRIVGIWPSKLALDSSPLKWSNLLIIYINGFDVLLRSMICICYRLL